MKLNKKGMTLVELIISIALISVILGFLFKILLDVKYETQNAGYAINNQVNRAEIIRVVQEDIINLGLIDAQSWNYYGEEQFELFMNDNIIVNIETQDNHKTLVYRTSETNSDGEGTTYRKWKIADEGYSYKNFNVERINSCFAMLKIEVVNETGENNPVDDIEILAKYSNCD